MRQVELGWLLERYRDAMAAGDKAEMQKLLLQLRRGGVLESVAGQGWDQGRGQKATRALVKNGRRPENIF